MIFGGRSGEHEVSLRSAKFVLDSLDPDKYDVQAIGISKTGEWLLEDDPMPLLEADSGQNRPPTQVPVNLPTTPPSTHRGSWLDKPIDVVFPVMHGPYGEDGTIQGLLELAGIAYVGSGVVGSAVGMDKALQKNVLSDHGIPVTSWKLFTRRAWRHEAELVLADIEKTFSYPVFVKPCNLGSSVGVTKVDTEPELGPALDIAATYDRRLIVEKAVPNAREIEVSVIGNEQPETSVCGEIIPGDEFYDYEAKYVNSASREVIPADIPDTLAVEIRKMACQAFAAIDAAGLARVDFLVDGETLDVVLNEINTIPGFTAISQFPKLWAATGVNNQKLLDRLIELALERHADRHQNKTTYN